MAPQAVICSKAGLPLILICLERKHSIIRPSRCQANKVCSKVAPWHALPKPRPALKRAIGLKNFTDSLPLGFRVTSQLGSFFRQSGEATASKTRYQANAAHHDYPGCIVVSCLVATALYALLLSLL